MSFCLWKCNLKLRNRDGGAHRYRNLTKYMALLAIEEWICGRMAPQKQAPTLRVPTGRVQRSERTKLVLEPDRQFSDGICPVSMKGVSLRGREK
jgi:hypothetical protein